MFQTMLPAMLPAMLQTMLRTMFQSRMQGTEGVQAVARLGWLGIGLMAIAAPAQAEPLTAGFSSVPMGDATIPTLSEMTVQTAQAADLLGSDHTAAAPFSETGETPPGAAIAPEGAISLLPGETADGGRNSANFNYIGLGGVIGLGGDVSGIGEGGFGTHGKTSFTENFALHTSGIIIGGNASVLTLTGNFPIHQNGDPSARIVAIPFVGGGISIKDLFDDDMEVAPALTVGVDVPLSYRWTVTGRFVSGFYEDDTDLGIGLGVGYSFPSLF